MTSPVDTISTLTAAERQKVEEQLSVILLTLKRTQSRVEAYKTGNTSVLKLLNDLKFARDLFDETLENLRKALGI